MSKLADVESREVLLAKLAGAMKGNLTKAAGLFQAPLSQIARLAAALQEKKAAEPGAEDRSGPPTAAAAAADETPGRLTEARPPTGTRTPTTGHRLTEERTPSWRSSAPTNCSTRSRR